MRVEICIAGEEVEAVRHAAASARAGGAATLELCRDMTQAGLTPTAAHVKAARSAWGTGTGLMVMVRPRGGDFCYSRAEEDAMAAQIRQAAETGAGGVVFGALRPTDGRVCETVMRRLVSVAGENDLATTFHRAFDATPDPAEALEAVIGLGIGRVLTSGCPWGNGGTALDGASVLGRMITQADGRIEVVIGGGVMAAGLARLRAALPRGGSPVAAHAYSGAQKNGVTDTAAVRALVTAAGTPP